MSYELHGPSSPELGPYLPPPQAALTGWHNASQIDSLASLSPGTYYWPELPEYWPGARITFRPAPALPGPPGYTGGSGEYTISNSTGFIDGGFYYLDPIPPARIRLAPTVPVYDRDIEVQGMFTGIGHVIQFMLLKGLGSPFVPFRMA